MFSTHGSQFRLLLRANMLFGRMLGGFVVSAALTFASLSYTQDAAAQTASDSSAKVAEIYQQADNADDNNAVASNGFLLANGYAKYIELDNDIYIGALFLGRLSNDPASIFDIEAKRIEMKIVPSRLAYKRFGQLLIKSSAINNAPRALVRNAEAMEAFLSVFRGNLVQGDHLVLANLADGFSVTMNGVELAVIESPDLFNMLLNIWIGTVPPSRDFRSRILGGENSMEFEEDFASLNFSPSRLAEIASWKMHQDVLAEAAIETEAAKDEAIAPVVPLTAAVKTPAPTKPSKAKPVASKKPVGTSVAASKPSPKNTSEKRNSKSAASADIALDDNAILVAAIGAKDAGPAKGKPLTQRSLAKSAETLKSDVKLADLDQISVDKSLIESEQENAGSTVAKASPPKAKPTRSIERSFSAQGLLAIQLYVNKLLVHSQQQMEYPKIARRMRQEGKVVASVTVDRNGKLIRYEITDESNFKTLNSAVEKGIKRSEPFPVIPSEIDGADFTFSVPVNFRYSG